MALHDPPTQLCILYVAINIDDIWIQLHRVEAGMSHDVSRKEQKNTTVYQVLRIVVIA